MNTKTKTEYPPIIWINLIVCAIAIIYAVMQ